MLVVEFSWTNFEAKMGIIREILIHERWVIQREGNKEEHPFGFLNYNDWRNLKILKINLPSHPKKGPLTNQIHLKHVFMVFIGWSFDNHTPIKYMCLNKKSSQSNTYIPQLLISLRFHVSSRITIIKWEFQACFMKLVWCKIVDKNQRSHMYG